MFPGTQMHYVTFFFILIEVVMLLHQFTQVLVRPLDSRRRWYMYLLLILVAYNVTGGLFPDPNISSIPLTLQNILAYGTGFGMGCFLPFYFWKGFGLKKMKNMARYGVILGLLLPFLIFFVIEYLMVGEIDKVRRHGIIIPSLYAIAAVWMMRRTIFEQRKTKREAFIIYMAILPWSIFPLLVFIGVSQLIEVLCTNGGFMAATVMYLWENIKESRKEYHRLAYLNENLQREVAERTEDLRVALDERDASHRQKENAFVNLLHETKTPLSLISLHLEELEEKHQGERNFEMLKRNIIKMTRNISTLFDIERMNKGISPYNHICVSNISELVQETVDSMRVIASKKGITVEEHLTPDLLCKADPVAITRMVGNLIENAIRYTPSGGRIWIDVYAARCLEISVRDTGPGIFPDQHEKILTPYYQISSEKGNSQGMGLGLPMVRSILDELDGTLHIDSDPAERVGTTFTLSLPRLKGVDEGLPMAATTEAFLPVLDEEEELLSATDYPTEGKRTILLVEDNRQIANALYLKLMPWFHIVVAQNGIEGLRIMEGRTVSPSVILSDIMMDEMDGFEFVSKLRDTPAYKHIPVIFISARGGEQAKIQGHDLGAVDYIEKPFSFPVLLSKLKALVAHEEEQQVLFMQRVQQWIQQPSSITQKQQFVTIPAPVHTLTLEQVCTKVGLSTRECEITHLIRKGLSNKEIGAQLNIAEGTVAKHVQNIFQKLEVKGRVQLLHVFEKYQNTQD